METFFFIPEEKAGTILECGLKLSVWASREIRLSTDYSEKRLVAFLNPADDPEHYRRPGFSCLKLNVPPEKCLVAEGSLYGAGEGLYESSCIPLPEYRFGTYRYPECLIGFTILPQDIQLMNEKRDIPILFTSSEDLFLNNLFEAAREIRPDFNDELLFLLMEKLVNENRAERIPCRRQGIALYRIRENNKVYPVKIPGEFGID